jgi:sugar-specific transcriptional regulator TrmB
VIDRLFRAHQAGFDRIAPGAGDLENRSCTKLIERIRDDMQARIDQLLAELEKLRGAVAALDPRERTTRRARPKPAAASKKHSTASRKPAAPSTASPRTRTAPGSTKASVLAALSKDGGMTAGEVAAATGLGRGTVSTTLSKLARSGEVANVERGYRLP